MKTISADTEPASLTLLWRLHAARDKVQFREIKEMPLMESERLIHPSIYPISVAAAPPVCPEHH